MASCREIVRLSMQITAVLGRREPSEAEALGGMLTLQSLYDEWTSQGVFGRLTDVVTDDATYTANEGERIAYTGESQSAITLPATVEGDDGETRAPRDLSIVIVAGLTDENEPTEQAFLYEANRGRWVDLKDLQLGDYAPLSARGAYGLAACLARHTASFDGQGIPAPAERAATRFYAAIANRSASPREEQRAVFY